MQLKPLRYCRAVRAQPVCGGSDASNKVRPIMYGCHAYMTYDGNFMINKHGDAWIIQPAGFYPGNNTLDAAGLFDARFPRRKDALEALEAMVEAIE